MPDNVEFVEGDTGIRECLATALMNAGDMSMLTELTWSGIQPCAASSPAMVSTFSTLRPSATDSTRRSTASAANVM